MQIFELHFNPELREEQFFDSFVYEPESSYEKKLGNLYMVGELQNSINRKLLDDIAQVFKKHYYSLSIKSPEKALSHASKKANEFLSEEVKKENISWLGNLNYGIISTNGLNLTFTKTGSLKILLLRNGQIIDMGKDLETQEIDPYPLKIFFNVVSGKLIENDKLLLLTSEVFEFLKEQNILSKLAKEIDAKIIKKILPPSLFDNGPGAKVSGVCFISTIVSKQERSESILLKNNIKASFLGKIISNLPKIKFPLRKRGGLPKIKVSIKKTSPFIEKFKNQINIKKRIFPIIGLLLVLFVGFYLFKGNPEKKELKVLIEEIRNKTNEAEELLISDDKNGANSLFQQAWKEIIILEENPEILLLKNSIKQNLNNINKIEYVNSPEIVVNLEDKSNIEKAKELASASGTKLIFLNKLYILENTWLDKDIEIDFNPKAFSSYFSNLYFLNGCEIIKYSHLSGTNWGSGKNWLNDKTDCFDPKSITVDEFIFMLNSNNSISVYYSGLHKKTINLDIFPEIKNISFIKTKVNVSYLYLLEPTNNRVVIIDKEGNLIKQFQSDKFNNLIDFDISPSGKTIYLLNSNTIYKLSL